MLLLCSDHTTHVSGHFVHVSNEGYLARGKGITSEGGCVTQTGLFRNEVGTLRIVSGTRSDRMVRTADSMVYLPYGGEDTMASTLCRWGSSRSPLPL